MPEPPAGATRDPATPSPVRIERIPVNKYAGHHAPFGVQLVRIPGGDSVAPISTVEGELTPMTVGGTVKLVTTPDGSLRQLVDAGATVALTTHRVLGVAAEGEALGGKVRLRRSGGDVVVFSIAREHFTALDVETNWRGKATGVTLSGAGFALSLGIAAARFENDDEFTPETVEKLLPLLRSWVRI